MTQPETIGIYHVLRELGRGAMGIVYLCLHPGLGRQVAVKVLSSQVADEADFVERFRREGEMAARLRHPNIVQVYDFSNDGETYFIVMEYLGSQTLKSGAARPLPEALRLIQELLAALAHAHEHGVIHRDLKPSNILLTDKGEVALTDFGIAYSAVNQKLTRTGTAMGTPEYMAPEQFDGKSDARSDLYSVGIIFYEMLTGFTPFRAEALTEVMKNQVLKSHAPLSEVDFTIPAAISQVVDKVLSKDPDQRYQSARELSDALKLASMAPLPPSPETTPLNLGGQPRSHGKGIALLLLALLPFLNWLRIQGYRQQHRTEPEVTPTTVALVIRDSPVPTSSPPTPAPTVVESKVPTPELALTETPEAVSPTPVAATGMLPEEGMIRPGLGVADLTLGDSCERVEELWGVPDSSSEEDGLLHWSYSGEGAENKRFGLVFEQFKLVQIDVYVPRFSVENHPSLELGIGVEKLREELANPTNDQSTLLEYRDLGISFYFSPTGAGEGRCEHIRVYPPGTGQTS